MTTPQLAARPGAVALLGGQLRYAITDLWRARVVVIFTVLLPLVWLVVIGFLAGNDAVDEASGVRVMQFVTPAAAAMGVLFGTYPTVAIATAQADESGVLKRLRATPLPGWALVAGRIGGAAAFAAVSVAVMVLVGSLVYDVQIIPRTLPAALVTLLVAVVSFAALGLAVAALAPSAGSAQAIAIATAVSLTFVSGLFTFGGAPPVWMTTIGDALPLKPFADALREQFNPFHTGTGWDPAALCVVAAWGAVAALVAAWVARREPRARTSTPSAARPVEQTSTVHDAERAATPPAIPGADTVLASVSAAGLVRDQAGAALRAVWRDPGSLFFAVAMPVGLYAFLLSSQGNYLLPNGYWFAISFAAGMAAWGIAVVAFLNLPTAVAVARERRVLKRLRGTPLAPSHYLLGRLAVALGMAWAIALAVLALAVGAYGAVARAGGVVVSIVVVIVGAVTFAACGMALASILPGSRAVAAVGLVVLLPLSFFSNVFVADAPDWMQDVGAVFPLYHLQNALLSAWTGGGLAVTHLAVMLAWAAGGALVAVRRFTWEPPY